MPTYQDENFDGVTAPALPSGWTSSGATVVTSTDKAYSGTNSLKFSGLSDNYGYAWNPTALETNDRNVVVEAIVSPGTLSGSNYLWLYVGNVTAPSGNSPGSGGVSFSLSMNGEGFCQIQNFDGGSRSTLGGITVGASFSTSEWYRIRFEVSESMDCDCARLVGYVQRISDGYWLTSAGTFADTGVEVPCIVFIDRVTPYPSGREDGTFVALGCYQASGQTLYWDSLTVVSHPGFLSGLPANPPSAGDEAELIPAATTAEQAGHASYPLSNLNGSSQTDGYIPNSTLNGTWVRLDAGSGNAVSPSAIHWIPTLAAHPTTGGGGSEQAIMGAYVEGSNDGTTWTQLGRLPGKYYPEQRVYNRHRLDPSTPGGTYRYIRLRALEYASLSQFRVICEDYSGSDWRPVPPVLTPAAGRFPTGQEVEATCATSGALMYYTQGPRGTITDPDNTDTQYVEPIVIPDGTGAEEWEIRIVAYHASGTEPYSRVTRGMYVVPARFVPDTGEVIQDYLGDADGPGVGSDVDQTPQDEYDTEGYLIHQNSSCVIPPSTIGGYYYRIGQNFNTGAVLSTGVFRGHYIYRGTNPLAINERCGFVRNLFPLAKARDTDAKGFQTRPGGLFNPSPLDADNTYVIAIHLGFSGGKMVFANSPSIESYDWTYGDIQQPYDETVGDCNVFYDASDLDESGLRGKAYFIFVSGVTNEMTIARLDQDEDWLTFRGTEPEVVFEIGGESPSLFKHDGYYYVVKSAGVPYGGGNSQLAYASATTLAGLASVVETTIWEDFPGAGPPVIVPYNIQNSYIFEVPFRTGKCYILCGDTMDPQGGTVGNEVTLYRARQGWYPISAVAGGGAIDSFPNPGELVVPSPTSWDLSALPPEIPDFVASWANRCNTVITPGII